MDGSSPSSSGLKATGGPAPRACDECRSKKTRCDHASPCSRCRASGLTCRTTTQRSKVRPERIHVTKKYEGKLDLMNDRLARIEHMLQQSRDHAQPSPPINAPPRPLSPVSNSPWNDTSRNSQFGNVSTVPTPAGDMGIQADSVAAKNVLEQTVDRDPDPAVYQDSKLRAALDALRVIIHRAHLDATDAPGALLSTTLSSSETPAPGWEQVEAVLERLESCTPTYFNWLSPALVDAFLEKCRSLYQQEQEGSPTDKLLVYSMMANICSELSSRDEGELADYNYGLSKDFSNLMLQILATFPMMTPPCLDAAEALMVAASTTVAMCKPLLTWSLTGATARMCQILGYHRLSRLKSESGPLLQRKIVLFWSTYVLDRSNALRLGRPSAIQDSEIDSPMLSDENSPALVALVKFWVDIGCVQGKICNSLYGSAAKSLSSDARAAIAEAFADELDQIQQRRLKTNAVMFGRQATTPAAELLVSGESVRHYGALTMALYAIPLNHPRSSRALETARKCLQVNRENCKDHMKNNNVYAWTVYCHWVLLDGPLTPFTGVVCNVIANPESSQEDLQLLEDFVASLKPAVPLSEGVEKFHQLCSIFVNVARAYVRAKAGQYHACECSGNHGFSQALQPAIGEFDELAATLGFFGPDFTTSQDLTMGSQPGMDVSDGLNPSIAEPAIKPSLLDWQSGDVSLYGLLEQDLNDIACGNMGEKQSNG